MLYIFSYVYQTEVGDEDKISQKKHIFLHCTAQKKINFSPNISQVNVTKYADLVTFTEEIFNGKLQY